MYETVLYDVRCHGCGKILSLWGEEYNDLRKSKHSPNQAWKKISSKQGGPKRFCCKRILTYSRNVAPTGLEN